MEHTSQHLKLLRGQEAAPILGTTCSTLKQSRYTGLLFGKPAPKFIKMGRSARYKLVELLKFRDQFPEYENTSQIAGDNHESV